MIIHFHKPSGGLFVACFVHIQISTQRQYNKSKKGLPLETKSTQNHENWRLGLVESLHMQHCSLRGYSIFKITRMGSMIPREIKYNLHYDDVRGDFYGCHTP